jgi:hypothetical protein
MTEPGAHADYLLAHRVLLRDRAATALAER